MTRTGIAWRALIGAPEPAIEECRERAAAIEMMVHQFLPSTKCAGEVSRLRGGGARGEAERTPSQ